MSVSVEPVWSLNLPIRRHAPARLLFVVFNPSYEAVKADAGNPSAESAMKSVTQSSGTRLDLLRPCGPVVKVHPLIMKTAAPHKYCHRNSKACSPRTDESV